MKVEKAVTDCIGLSKEFLVEECLLKYESRFEQVGFNGGEIGSEDYYLSYGNLTLSYVDIAEAEAHA